MAETAAEKKAREEEEARKTAEQKNIEEAKEKAKNASDKSADERTPDEQRAAEESARAKVAQEQFEAAQKAEAEANKLAEKNDKKDTKPLNFADQVIAEKLAHAGSPEAQANENESYVLKQQLYQQAGLSAPEVLATAHKATTEAGTNENSNNS